MTSLTFHRAIDLSRDLQAAARQVAQLGFSRILTSGGAQTAAAGAANIADIVQGSQIQKERAVEI